MVVRARELTGSAMVGIEKAARRHPREPGLRSAGRMIRLEAPFRYATAQDATALAQLVNCAGEGLPLYLWGNMAEPGESAWEVGRRRAQREAGSFSYRNAVVVEADGRVVAALVGYPLPDAP
jgi:hypothetical protein